MDTSFIQTNDLVRQGAVMILISMELRKIIVKKFWNAPVKLEKQKAI